MRFIYSTTFSLQILSSKFPIKLNQTFDSKGDLRHFCYRIYQVSLKYSLYDGLKLDSSLYFILENHRMHSITQHR